MEAKTLSINRKQPPLIKDAVEFDLKLKPYEKYILRNGVEVYAIDAGAEEVVMLDLVFYAGNWFEKRNLVAASTNYLLKNGTSTKNAFQINEHFEYYGSYLNRSCYNETATVTLHSLTKHLPELLPVIKELLVDAVFPEEEIATYKQNMKQRLNVNLKKCDFVATRLIDAYLYGEEHPYGRYTRFEDFDVLSHSELQDYYRDYYQNGKLVIFVAGKLPPDLEALLDASFGDLKNNNVAVTNMTSHAASEKKYRITNDPNGVQGAIRMGQPFPNRHHPDFMKAMVLNNLFGGFFWFKTDEQYT